MRKQIILIIIYTGLMLLGIVIYSTMSTNFSCNAQFSVSQKINTDEISSEGMMSIDLSENHLFIKVDGFLIHNNKKYIISRTMKMKHEIYNDNANLHKLLSIKTSRDETDNMDDIFANRFLFGDTAEEKIIFIKKINDNIILFGNHTFPQYGCKQR